MCNTGEEGRSKGILSALSQHPLCPLSLERPLWPLSLERTWTSRPHSSARCPAASWSARACIPWYLRRHVRPSGRKGKSQGGKRGAGAEREGGREGERLQPMNESEVGSVRGEELKEFPPSRTR